MDPMHFQRLSGHSFFLEKEVSTQYPTQLLRCPQFENQCFLSAGRPLPGLRLYGFHDDLSARCSECPDELVHRNIGGGTFDPGDAWLARLEDCSKLLLRQLQGFSLSNS